MLRPRLEVTYGTDGAAVERGFWFDNVNLTDVEVVVPHVGSDIFADGFESENTNAWSNAVP